MKDIIRRFDTLFCEGRASPCMPENRNAASRACIASASAKALPVPRSLGGCRGKRVRSDTSVNGVQRCRRDAVKAGVGAVLSNGEIYPLAVAARRGGSRRAEIRSDAAPRPWQGAGTFHDHLPPARTERPVVWGDRSIHAKSGGDASHRSVQACLVPHTMRLIAMCGASPNPGIGQPGSAG
jgi:hypothetical protein